MRIPLAWVRITPETAPTWIQRVSSSDVSRFSKSAKKPPMSEPQVLTPDSPIVSPFVTAERRPSKPQSTLGSPPQTTGEQRAEPVQPERANRSARGAAVQIIGLKYVVTTRPARWKRPTRSRSASRRPAWLSHGR